MSSSITLLMLASEFKGADFIREIKRQGCRTIVIAREAFRDHPWPHDSIDEFHTMPDLRRQPDLTYAVAYLMRFQKIDRIVALDDFDVEHVADLREHFRLPGMTHSVARLFRDKLAMRSEAAYHKLLQPDFVAVANHQNINDFISSHASPWIFKPRTLAGSEGIRLIEQSEALWQHIDALGNHQSQHLLEEFITGEIYHVDTLTWNNEVIFTKVSKYGAPPLEMLQSQGLFSTQTLGNDDPDAHALTKINSTLLDAFNRGYGPSHTEFIKARNGELYFLETSARVAGGNIERTIQCATGISLWHESANMEIASIMEQEYELPQTQSEFSGLLACPLKGRSITLDEFKEPEIKFKFKQDGFITLVFQSNDAGRIEQLISEYGHKLNTL